MYENIPSKTEEPLLIYLAWVLLAIILAIASVRFVDDSVLRSSLYGCVLSWVIYKVYHLIIK